MVDQRKRILAVSLWTLDLALTATSFFLAYRIRLLFYIEGHSVLPVQKYLWLLAVILPTWAILLPASVVPARAAGRFAPPAAPMLYTRRLERVLGDGASFVVVRSFAVRFVPDAAGFRDDAGDEGGQHDGQRKHQGNLDGFVDQVDNGFFGQGALLPSARLCETSHQRTDDQAPAVDKDEQDDLEWQ